MLGAGCGCRAVPFSSSFSTAIALLVSVGGQIPMETISGKSKVIVTAFGIANQEELSCLSKVKGSHSRWAAEMRWGNRAFSGVDLTSVAHS